MARYDYRCSSCGEVFEVEHSMTAHPPISCPSCGSAADKLFNAAGIVFEGNGFYNTDQRDMRAASAAGAERHGTEKPACAECGCAKDAAGACKNISSGDVAAVGAQKTPEKKEATRGK